jgi:hypothetical protein
MYGAVAMARLVSLLVCWLALTVGAFPQNVEIDFEVRMGDDHIGTIKAVVIRQGKSTIMEVRSKTETTLLAITVQSESVISVTKENNVVIQGVAWRKVNPGPDDIHTTVKKTGVNTYHHECNGDVRNEESADITLCVTDLYFTEPKGVTSIFSNMHGEYVPLKKLTADTYRLVTPDNKDSFYTYKNGKLVLIEADTPLGKIVSKRI